MSCVTSSVAAPAAPIVAPTSSSLGVGSIIAANLACNPSLSAPPSVSLHSSPAAPLASVQTISQLYTNNFSLPPGTTIAATAPTLLRQPPSLQLLVASVAEESGDKAAIDLGSGYIDRDIDIVDIDMDGEFGAGSGHDSDVDSDDHARPSVSQPVDGSSAKQGRRPASPARALARGTTASGSRQPQLHGHSLSESQISPIRSLTALALSQSRPPSPSPQLGQAAVTATQSLRPPLDVRAQQELLLKVEDIQRYCDSLRQVQAQQESKIRSLEATVRRLSDATLPLSTHQLTPTAATATSSAATQLVSAAVSPPPPLSSIDELMPLHYHHQRAMQPPAFAPLAAAGRSRPIPHLPPIQASMALLSSVSMHRASDVTPPTYMESESLQYPHPPQPTVAYQQSHSTSTAVVSEHRAATQTGTVIEQHQQHQHQHGSLPLPLATVQQSRHYVLSQQASAQTSPTSLAPRLSGQTLGHQQPQAYRQSQSTSYGGGGGQFSPKMARQVSPLSLSAMGGSQAHRHHHHRSLGTSSRSQLHQHSYQRTGGSASRSRRGSAALPMPLEGDRGAMSAPYAAPLGYGEEREGRQPTQRQFLPPPPPLLVSSSSSSRRASVGPSAFGYSAVAAAAMPAPLGSATSADFGMHSAGAIEEDQVGSFPATPSGHPSMRMKRPRDTESGDEFAGADAHPSGAADGDTAGDAAMSHTPSRAYSMHQQHMQPPPHLHHHPTQSRHSHSSSHLPPIRVGGGDSSQQAAPPGWPRTAATNFGSSAGGSLHLVQPSVVSYEHSSHAAYKGKSVASDYSGAVDGPVFNGGEQSARGNRDAQPTHTWLASQRQYKTALLHLLSLESFYPSDMAMLNMFRSMGDFTAEQVEAHGATMLSWARGWLRYSRNAVLRSTLDNKAKEPIKTLAEALQHDLHSDIDFTTPPNLRRCTLLRLIYFRWQSVNKLGTKSQSMYRDYETQLRELDALPTFEEQEQEWEKIIKEEQQRRLDNIREARQRSESIIQPRTRVRPEQMFQSKIQMTVAPPLPPPSVPPQMLASAPTSASATSGQSELAHGTSAMQQLSLSRRQSGDWMPSYPPPLPDQSPTPGSSHYHYSTQQQQQHPQNYQGPPLPMDNDSEMSVNLSPEPQ
ncbi:hypothetical protein IW152_002034 [Coemansia sp. BCRC 34962]|nr:hypothetical protein IW152_002034 [Coemansia sp. BCRC 34962]